MSLSPTPEPTSRRYDIDGLLADIDGLPVKLEPVVVKRRSRDFFWYSPILNEQLAGKAADVIVTPRDEAELVRLAAACAKRRIPLTPRGAGAGNYGQAVPLEGGVLLDMSAFDQVLWQKPGVVRVQAGMKMHDLDAALKPSGF